MNLKRPLATLVAAFGIGGLTGCDNDHSESVIHSDIEENVAVEVSPVSFSTLVEENVTLSDTALSPKDLEDFNAFMDETRSAKAENLEQNLLIEPR